MSILVYMATHQKIEHIPFDYIIPIHVGAALRDEKYAVATDTIGDNISKKNPQFCELTALYWMWKNIDSDYLGLCHYRRFFNLPTTQAILKVVQNGKIILPRKVYFKKTVYEQYRDCHGLQEWDIMMEVLNSLSPEYIETAMRVFSANSLIPYNMFIACEKWVEGYCEWLFPLLFAVAKRMEVINSIKARYIGFLSERLLSVYIITNHCLVQECDIIDANGKLIRQSRFGIKARKIVFSIKKNRKRGQNDNSTHHLPKKRKFFE